MADALSMMAIAGLAFIGKKLSDKKEKYTQPVSKTKEPEQTEETKRNLMLFSSGPEKSEMSSFADIKPQQRSSGSEMLDMRGRMYDAGRMNNLSPVEKQLVGPGLGVNPSVPAFGGYQQLFRVNPDNVGAYKLTTLPGRHNHPHDLHGGRRGVMGEFNQNRPEKTADLSSRLPPTMGRAQGMSGVVPRGEHEKTKIVTARAHSGYRNDTLGFGGAKSLVSGLTEAQDPTRNKMDGNIQQYSYNNHPVPNINKYTHGYINSPASIIGEKRTYGSMYTVEELQKYGFRPDERRSKVNRIGNAGRMNVRSNPLNQGGMLTSVRSDVTRIDNRENYRNGTSTQNYVNNSYHNLNPYKGKMNPHASNKSLSMAKEQLKNNPLVNTF